MAMVIDGNADEVQLTVQGHSTQTEALQVWENSAGDEQAQITGDGRLQVGSFDSGQMATDDSLIEAHRDESDTTKPKRGLHLLGEITGTLDSIVAWVVQELFLKGTGGISALHSALRVRLSNENTGTMASGAELRGADVEVINNGGSSGNNVPELTGLRVGVTNQTDGYADAAYGLKVEMIDEGSLEQAYAIHTDEGVVHLGDELELKIFDPLPGNDPEDSDFLRVFATVEGGRPRLYGKISGEDPQLIAGGDYDFSSSAAVIKKSIQTQTLLWKKALSSTGVFDTNDSPDEGTSDLSGYDHLLIRGRLRSTKSTNDLDSVVIYFNNDTTDTNYHFTQAYGEDGGVLGGEADNSRTVNSTAANANSDDYSAMEIHIPAYAGSKRKQAIGHGGLRRNSGRSDVIIATTNWENTAAISRIALHSGDTNFVAGSFIEVIGIKVEDVVIDVGFPAITDTDTDTTDASATTIDSVSTESNTSYLVTARIVARRTGGAAGSAGDSASYHIRGAFKNVAGTVSQVGSTDKTALEDQSAWDADFSINGTEVEIQVTGAANNDVSWTCARDVVPG